MEIREDEPSRFDLSLFRSFNLYVRAEVEPGVPPGELLTRQKEFRARLEQIWNVSQPAPFPLTYHDFRRAVIDQILERLRKEDPRFRRPRF